ncbi:MAG: protein kinase [Deltaproteobacteria bacterium]|nr:protein kinase [Deltaproteobacteria bacterium]
MSVERTRELARDDDDPTIDSMLRDAAATVALGMPTEFAGTERFELVRRLGEGGFGVVFEAIDRVDGGRVALKVLRRPYAERLYRFKREFRALTELVHPNLVRLHDLFADGHDIFFTMECIDGASPREHLAARPDDLLDVLRQLAEGLAALHAAGKLHRDVKPSNILVERGGRVVLLDFGLAVDKDEHTSELAGTPLYMSPEQHRGEPLTEASDWYAFGVVLFELLTGEAPAPEGAPRASTLAGETPAPERCAPRASTLAEGISPELDELCAALLEREPARRAGGDDVLRRLRGAPRPPARTERFVGRTAELATLAELFERSAAGQGVVALARGPSGIGKSALLRRFVEALRVRAPDAMVLAGRCYERESVPYKALDAVIDELAHKLRRLPARVSASLMPRDAHALEQLFPVLRQVPGFQEACASRHDHGDAAEVRARGTSALRELFARLADRWPVVVCVDDLQWGDVDSALLLAELWRPPAAPAVFWLATFREEEATTSPLLRHLDTLREGALRDVAVHELHLAGLGDDDARALAAALLADSDDARARAIAHESGGSPFFVHELARLRDGHHALADLVRHRLGPLEGAARRVLEVVAVGARPLDVAVVAAAAGARDELRPALATLRAEHLIRLRDGAPKLVEVYHDRIREAVVRDLRDRALRATHRRLAAALEERGDSDPAQVGSHLADGGEPERAIAFLVRAAERATSALALDEAARLYQRALDLCGQLAEPADTLALELASAAVLSNADRGLDAARRWSQVLDRVDGSRRTDLRRRAAEEMLHHGRIDEGYAILGTVLDELDLAMPRSRAGAVARIAWGRLRDAMSRGRLHRRRAPPGERELQRIDALGGMVWTTTLLDPLMAAALQTQYLALALRSGDPIRATRALSLDAGLAALAGSHARSARSLARARVIAPHAGETIYALELAEGIVDLLEGRWIASLERLAEVERHAFQVRGHSSIRGTVYLTQIMNLFWMGRSGDALRRLPALIGDMDQRGNRNGWLWLSLLEAWALSCSGRLDEAWARHAEVEARLPARGFQVLRWYLEFGKVKFLLLEDKGEEAWRQLEEAERRTRFGFIAGSQRLSKAWVRASAALLRGAQQPAQRSAMLAEARRQLRRLAKERPGWVKAVIHGLGACIASVEGRGDDALRLLAEAEPLLETYHLEAPLAVARLVRGRAIGGELGAEAAARGQAWMDAQLASPAIARVLLPGAWSAPR